MTDRNRPDAPTCPGDGAFVDLAHGLLERTEEEGILGHLHVPKAMLIQEAPDRSITEESRIEFHEDVEPLLLEEVGADGLDLIGGTAVHRGEGYRGDHVWRDGENSIL